MLCKVYLHCVSLRTTCLRGILERKLGVNALNKRDELVMNQSLSYLLLPYLNSQPICQISDDSDRK